MEEVKTKHLKDDFEKESSKRSHRDKDRGDRHRDKEKKSREKDGDRDHHHHRSSDKKDKKDREREKSSDEKHRDRDRERESSEEKHRDREREKSTEEKHRDRDKGRHKDRHREKDRAERGSRDRVRDKDREAEKEREKEREREKKERDREREREKKERDREREREKRERDRIRGREKRRETDRDHSSDENADRDRDRKRRKREEGHRDRERDTELSSKAKKYKGGEESPQKRGDENFVDLKVEEDPAEEQRKLDEEMEKRRRRVQEWQELKRKKEESHRESLGIAANAEELQSGKAWTLEGESDDEDAGADGKEEDEMNLDVTGNSIGRDEDLMAVDSENGHPVPADQNGPDGNMSEEEIDPLDAFMNSVVLPEVERLTEPPASEDGNSNSKERSSRVKGNGEPDQKGKNKSLGRIIAGEDTDSDYEDSENDADSLEDDEDDAEFVKRVKKTKAEKLAVVDHSKIEYPPFRKNFYIEVRDVSKMTPDEVASYRKQLELKIHGKDVPKPIKTWHQTGLSTKILETIRKLNFETPMSIQAQALPVIMSGRDCIGIAKTGSGKTLAFVLPMLRHIMDQSPLMQGDGPIGLIMAPTRELVQQIYSDIKKFSKILGLSCVPVYGGSGVAQQISDLKRGAEIVVCTPGRMIDILCTSAGKITNLRRVTYLVMDEADRMFDMGFEPQITKIVQNTRPDRQTVLFSATFPRQVEILARKILNKPVEIQVGGRSVVNKDITQLVELRPESDRFFRLLELLGESSKKGKILIFVHSQEKCDSLFRDLINRGHACLSLHGAKDQSDRESTINDFKNNTCNLLIATSIAARGLDVKDLELVINFDAPNHYEDYVHRVGRTGRAGKKGAAITFISEDDAKYAPDLVKALQLSEQVVPDDLKALADGFMAKVNQGLEQSHGTGYGGSGFKFNEEEDDVRKAAKKAQAKEYGYEDDKSDSDDEEVRKTGGSDISQLVPTIMASNGNIPAASAIMTSNGLGIMPTNGVAIAHAAALNLKNNLAKLHAAALPEHYEAELEINDFQQNARWKVTHKETLGPISDFTGAAITTRGQFYPQGKTPGPGDRKLFLFIEGPSEQSVKSAKALLKKALEDITSQASTLPGSAQPGKYSVI